MKNASPRPSGLRELHECSRANIESPRFFGLCRCAHVEKIVLKGESWLPLSFPEIEEQALEGGLVPGLVGEIADVALAA